MHARAVEASVRAPAVVLIPGLGLSGDYLMPLAQRIGAQLPAYVIDVPGSGGCPGPALPLTPGHLGEVIARWLDANELERVVVFGNSFGSQVALEVARRQPDRVIGAVLAAPTPDARSRSWWVQFGRLMRAAAIAPAGFTLVAARDYRRTGWQRLLRESRRALNEPIRDRLDSTFVPALVIRGARDPVVHQAWAEEVAQRVRAPLHVVPEAGHAAPASAPAAVAEAIVAFARAVDARLPASPSRNEGR